MKTFLQRYEKEYLDNLAFGLVQFWPVGEELPDNDAKESEIFYKVSISRLSDEQRRGLVKRLRRMTTRASKVFDVEFRGTPECRELVDSVIARFPQLFETRNKRSAACL